VIRVSEDHFTRGTSPFLFFLIDISVPDLIALLNDYDDRDADEGADSKEYKKRI
jgi:hypothetical protein